MKYQILEQIKAYHRSATRPIYSSELEKRYGLTGSAIRSIIRQLRREGEPIGSGMDGYYYCSTRAELDHLIEDLKGRALSMIKTLSKLEKNREKPGYQQAQLF